MTNVSLKFNLSDLYVQETLPFYQKDSFRQTVKKISLIAAGLFFSGFLGSVTLLRATPAVIQFAVKFFGYSTLTSAIVALATHLFGKGKDHPEKIRELEEEIALKLRNSKGLVNVLHSEHPDVERFVIHPADKKNRKVIEDYLDTQIESAIYSVDAFLDFYRKEGQYLKFLNKEHRFFKDINLMVQYLDINAEDKKRIRARYQAEENRICAESGLNAMELKLDSKRLELSRARQTKESSLVNGLTQLASTASHFENSGKLQQKEQLQSQLLGYESQRSLNSYEEQQLEQLLSQIETLKTTNCSYSESTSVQNKIDALEKQANRLRFGKDMTFRELESQKQKMQQKIASIKPQSVLSTALHATNATYNAVVFFNQGQKIKNLEEEVSSLSSKLDEIRAQITPRIKQLNREREKALDEQEVSIRKLLEARLEKLEASN
jgi:hypothetical protein